MKNLWLFVGIDSVFVRHDSAEQTSLLCARCSVRLC